MVKDILEKYMWGDCTCDNACDICFIPRNIKNSIADIKALLPEKEKNAETQYDRGGNDMIDDVKLLLFGSKK